MSPVNVIGEISGTTALAIRLCRTVMSGIANAGILIFAKAPKERATRRRSASGPGSPRAGEISTLKTGQFERSWACCPTAAPRPAWTCTNYRRAITGYHHHDAADERGSRREERQHA
jgi:hypothetical protein